MVKDLYIELSTIKIKRLCKWNEIHTQNCRYCLFIISISWPGFTTYDIISNNKLFQVY